MKPSQKILIVGLFLSEANKDKIYRTAADQLAELLFKNGYGIITVSNKVNRFFRMINTFSAIFFKSRQYKIAVVPLYGTLFSYWWTFTSTLLLKLLKKKIVLVIHGGSIPDRMRRNPNKFLKVIRLADTVICPSPFIFNTLNQHDIKGVLVENVINLHDYKFNHKEIFRPAIFWMRTLEDIYNPEMAVRVLAILRNKYPGARLVMAGRDHGSLKHVLALAADLGVQHLIELPGYISNRQKNKLAKDLDIYICTNQIDNAPVSLIEMMALGLPVVSVNVGGIPYLLKHGYNGLLVNLHDDQAMAEQISTIIESPNLGKQLATNGLAFSENFGEEKVIKKWTKVFEELGYN